MTEIGQAVPDACVTIAGERLWQIRVGAGIAGLVSLVCADAVGPRVVRIDRDAFCGTLPKSQQQAVVAGITTALISTRFCTYWPVCCRSINVRRRLVFVFTKVEQSAPAAAVIV